jgi:Uma2 family endonuclease
MVMLMGREVREGSVRIRWTPEALDDLIRRGELDAERRYEILNGELFEKMGHNWPHAFAVSALQLAFRQLDADNFYVSSQLPLRIGQDLLEPDLKVIRGSLVGRRETPTAEDALLVIEVSDSTYATDSRIKLPIYARSNVEVYWIVDVNLRRVEVFTNPVEGGYGKVAVFDETSVLPPAFDGCPSIVVSDLFVKET